MTLGVLLPAVFSGVTAAFFRNFDRPAIACYPVGFIVGLMWNYMYVATGEIRTNTFSSWRWFIGAGQLLGTVLLNRAVPC